MKVECLPGSIVVVILMIVISSSFFPSIASPISQTQKTTSFAYTTHLPVRIDGNEGFSEQGWPGDGTAYDPYVISGLDIDAVSENGIDIRNTTVYFSIEKCIIHDGASNFHGINLYNCANGTVSNNNCLRNWYGVYLYSSNNNTIGNNNCSNNLLGMELSYSRDNVIRNNTCYNNSYGIYFYSSSDNTIRNNTYSSNNHYGMWFFSSSDGNSLSNNFCSNNGWCGIRLHSSSNNWIWNNTFIGNHGSGSISDPLANQANDDGTNNHWNSTSGYGNWWSDCKTPDILAPLGIIDEPYNVMGGSSAKDHYPRAFQTCTITSPTSASTFTTTWGWIKLVGSAYDQIAVTNVIWSNSLGGSGVAYMTPQYGGTIVTWQSRGNVQLFPGVNVITATAYNHANKCAVDILTVTYCGNFEKVPPACMITSPTSASTYLTNWGWINLIGTASDDVGVNNVAWSNSLGGSGVAYMTPQYGGTSVSWQSRGNVQLFSGVNSITVTVHDSAGNTATDVLTVTYDSVPPACKILSPTSSTTYLTNSGTINLSGSVSDNIAVGTVTWYNLATRISGIAAGTTSWSIPSITINEGSNLIYVNATDNAGNKGSDAIWVTSDSTRGSRVTFAGVPTGTTQSIQYLDIMGNTATDVVVIDGALWFMYRSSNNAEVARYHPYYPGSSWNISFEAYAPKTGSAYIGMDPGRFGLRAIIKSGSTELAGVEIAVGNSTSEGIYVLEGSTWNLVRHDIAPAFPGGDSSNGEKADRYVVSFELKQGIITAMVRHTVLGTLLVRSFPADMADAVIHLCSDSTVRMGGSAPYIRSVNGGWMVDDLTIRGPDTTYPILPLLWLEAPQGGPVRVKMMDEGGVPIAVQMRIANKVAVRSGSYYEASYPRTVNWSVETMIDVDTGPVIFRDSVKVTTTSTVLGARVTNWWGGWAWVSVLGTDDCKGFGTTKSIYSGYDHPLTAYVMTRSGSSADILASQSELALHLPHDFLNWKTMNWSGAVASANSGHSQLESYYTYASRWDNPAYVGKGDTYISLANPGSAATYQMMFAQYQRGTRIMGDSSNFVDTVAGNSSLYGSWILPNSHWWTTPGHSWQPSRPEDMLDSYRAWNTDGNGAPWNIVKSIASQGGLLRIYNHQSIKSNAATVVHWIVDPKTNFSYENWKATDGEVASYVYASHTTSISKNISAGSMAYDICRQNPKAAGYWLVPVTVAIDLLGRHVSQVCVIEHTSNGDVTKILRPLLSKRVMDLGYDIRNDTLFVSDFFNASATIIVTTLTVTITDPTSDPNMNASWHMICLKGTASEGVKVTVVTWSNSLGGSGVAYLTPQWGGPIVSWQSRGNVYLLPGTNVITVKAFDSAGNNASDTLAVLYDPTPPSCMITKPGTDPYINNINSINIAGTASDNVGVTSVKWSNAATGNSGTAIGTTSWSVAVINLNLGNNLITVTSYGDTGKTASDTLTVVYDPTVPTCIITKPASDLYCNTTGSINLAGMASDDSLVTTVTWANDRGGSGTCSGTNSWSQNNIILYAGWNNITVTAWDNGVPQKNGSDSIRAIYDVTNPTITITSPTAMTRYDTTGTTANLGGIAWDNINITTISWINTRGGFGSQTGKTSWTINSIPLFAGWNNITVTVTDEAGNTGSDTFSVIRDNVIPTCVITMPASDFVYTASGKFNLSGTAYDNIGIVSVMWMNAATCASGICTGMTSWSQNGIALNSGNNVIIVTTYDAASNSANDSITVINGIIPNVTITNPTSSPTMTTGWHMIYLVGTASDDSFVTRVVWSNSLGGSGVAYMTPQYGGTSVTWQSRGNVLLYQGDNVITVTAYDDVGNSATDVLTVIYTEV